MPILQPKDTVSTVFFSFYMVFSEKIERQLATISPVRGCGLVYKLVYFPALSFCASACSKAVEICVYIFSVVERSL